MEMMMTAYTGHPHLTVDALPGVNQDAGVHEVDDVPGVGEDVLAGVVSIGDIIGKRAPDVPVQVRLNFTLLKSENILVLVLSWGLREDIISWFLLFHSYFISHRQDLTNLNQIK